MKIEELLGVIGTEVDEKQAKSESRRESIKDLAAAVSRTAALALPMIFGDVFKKAYSQTAIASNILNLINFSLKVEYYLAAFYNFAITDTFPAGGAGAFPSLPATQQTGLRTINADHLNHIQFLKTFLTGANPVPYDPTGVVFDFTAAQVFPDVGSNPVTLLLVAQILEDISLRSYKGQIASFTGLGDLATSLFNIHSVEARHSSYIRYIRRLSTAPVKPWLSQAGSGASGIDTTTPAGTLENSNVSQVYVTEDTKLQAQINIIGIDGYAQIDINAGTEAFDEPLAQAQIQGILNTLTGINNQI